MREESFFKGAFYLTAAGILVKLMGSANRIVLSRLLGGEGIGLYQMAYPIYLLFLGLSSAGLPVAISVLVAERTALSDYGGARKIFRLSFILLIITGCLFSLLLYYGASWLISWQIIRDQRAYYAIIVLAPAVFLVTVMSSYRGYFQGCQTMVPTALSQVVEQFVRIVTMLGLVFLLLPQGLAYAAAGASFGAVPGAAAGLFLLIYYDYRYKHFFLRGRIGLGWKSKEQFTSIMARLIRLALPVSLAHIIMPIVASIDLMIVPLRLEMAGYTIQQATELFGYLAGMAVTLMNVPTILTGALAASLVPDVARTAALQQKEALIEKLELALRLANWITIPASMGLYLLAGPLSLLLYGTNHAGPVTSILACGIVFLGMQQVTTGILQGLGHTLIPVVSLAIAAVVKIFLNYTLTALPDWGITGAAWATVVDFFVASMLNLTALRLSLHSAWPLKGLGPVLGATLCMGGTVLFIYHTAMTALYHNGAAVGGAIMGGIVVYVVTFLILGGFCQTDMERIPKIGLPLSRILHQFTIRR
ncbi:MAG: polysaccharide biosynthesis protein [Sporomusaceae bacterium]|nr:polysaccharide biosynthesis protein [Sporomusaceae bacterium]